MWCLTILMREREERERGMFLFKYWILCLLIEQSSNSCCVYSRTQYIIYTVFICNKWNQNLKLFWFLKGICPIHKQLGLIHMIHIWKSYVDYIHVICFIRDHKKASYLNHLWKIMILIWTAQKYMWWNCLYTSGIL